MPAYVLVFVLLGQYDARSPLQSRALRRRLPAAGDPLARGGAIVVLTRRPLPVRLRARARRLPRASRAQTFEAARTLGLRHGAAVRRVALPLARPALAAGAALAVMEALADFGTVNLLGYRAMTDAIYRVWYGAFDQAAALQLATVLVGLTFGARRLERAAARAGPLPPGARPRRGGRAAAPAGLAALARGGLPVALLLGRRRRPGRPARRLVGRAAGDGARGADLVSDGLHSAPARRAPRPSSPSLAATVVAYGAPARGRPAAGRRRARLGDARLRGARHRRRRRRLRPAGVGRPPPRRRRRRARRRARPGLHRHVLGLIIAYLVRFHALAYLSRRVRMARIDPDLDDAARSLGADRDRVLADVHLPLLWPGHRHRRAARASSR